MRLIISEAVKDLAAKTGKKNVILTRIVMLIFLMKMVINNPMLFAAITGASWLLGNAWMTQTAQ